MDSLKVFIENLPPPEGWHVKWIPIIIALCAIGVSLYSLYLSRKQYRHSSRPFLCCLTNYLAIRNDGPPFYRPEILPIKIINAPALIQKMKIEFCILSGGQKTILHSAEESGLVRFPVEPTEASYQYAELTEKLQRCGPEDTLERHVRIDYTSLSGGKKYFYENRSKYNLTGNIWDSVDEKAS